MATVQYPDGRPSFEIPDNDAALCAYYLGEGATVSKEAPPMQFPAVFSGGDDYEAPLEVAETDPPSPLGDDGIPVLQLPEGQSFQIDDTVRESDGTSPLPDATGQVIDADGQPVEVDHPRPGPGDVTNPTE